MSYLIALRRKDRWLPSIMGSGKGQMPVVGELISYSFRGETVTARVTAVREESTGNAVDGPTSVVDAEEV